VFDGHGGDTAAHWLHDGLYNSLVGAIDRSFTQADAQQEPIPGKLHITRPVKVENILTKVFADVDARLCKHLLGEAPARGSTGEGGLLATAAAARRQPAKDSKGLPHTPSASSPAAAAAAAAVVARTPAEVIQQQQQQQQQLLLTHAATPVTATCVARSVSHYHQQHPPHSSGRPAPPSVLPAAAHTGRVRSNTKGTPGTPMSCYDAAPAAQGAPTAAACNPPPPPPVTSLHIPP
jgi:hypothetical protein